MNQYSAKLCDTIDDWLAEETDLGVCRRAGASVRLTEKINSILCVDKMQTVVDAARQALHHLSQREDIRAIDVLGDALTALDGKE